METETKQDGVIPSDEAIGAQQQRGDQMNLPGVGGDALTKLREAHQKDRKRYSRKRVKQAIRCGSDQIGPWLKGTKEPTRRSDVNARIRKAFPELFAEGVDRREAQAGTEPVTQKVSLAQSVLPLVLMALKSDANAVQEILRGESVTLHDDMRNLLAHVVLQLIRVGKIDEVVLHRQLQGEPVDPSNMPEILRTFMRKGVVEGRRG